MAKAVHDVLSTPGLGPDKQITVHQKSHHPAPYPVISIVIIGTQQPSDSPEMHFSF